MDDLLKQAEELGIKVDKRWTAETLQKKIDAALGGDDNKDDDVAEEKLFPVVLLKNYRPIGAFKISEKEGDRDPDEQEVNKVPAGSTILIGVDEAKSVIAKKIAERADAIG